MPPHYSSLSNGERSLGSWNYVGCVAIICIYWLVFLILKVIVVTVVVLLSSGSIIVGYEKGWQLSYLKIKFKYVNSHINLIKHIVEFAEFSQKTKIDQKAYEKLPSEIRTQIGK